MSELHMDLNLYFNQASKTSPALADFRDQLYLAFVANDSGRSEVYIQRFDESDEPKLTADRRRVSHDGGTSPRWRSDGKELFFISRSGQLMAAAVTPGNNMELVAPQALFALPPSSPRASGILSYDVSANGQKILAPKGIASAHLVDVVLNWQQGLHT